MVNLENRKKKIGERSKINRESEKLKKQRIKNREGIALKEVKKDEKCRFFLKKKYEIQDKDKINALEKKSRRGRKRNLRKSKNSKKTRNTKMRGGSFVPANDLNINFGSSLGLNQLSNKMFGASYISSDVANQPIATQYGPQNKYMV